MTEVQGSDEKNAAIREQKGFTEEVETFAVTAEAVESKAEETRLHMDPPADVEVPEEEGEQYALADVAPPVDQTHVEADVLPPPLPDAPEDLPPV